MTDKSKIWYLILICMIIIVVFLFIIGFTNPIYLDNFSNLLIYFWLIPTFLFLVVVIIFSRCFSFDADLKMICLGLYYVLPLGFIYSLVEEYYHRSQHIFSNFVLSFGTIFIVLILYLAAGKLLLVLIDKKFDALWYIKQVFLLIKRKILK
jgi:hypothetical protein